MSSAPTSGVTVLSVPSPLPENPYQRLLYGALDRSGARIVTESALLKPDDSPRILHVHWMWLKDGRMRRFVRSRRFRRTIGRARSLGWRIVWTAHNVLPHEHRADDVRLREHLVANCDGIIVHTEATRDAVMETFDPACPVSVIPHGHYRDAYAAPPTRAEARSALRLPDRPVILFFGQIQPYKGVDDLIGAFRRTSIDATLLVCGTPRTPDGGDRLRELARGDDRIRLDLRYIPDDETPRVFAAADRVALPFRQITTSGSVILALSFDRPVVIPSFQPLLEVCGPDAAEVYQGPDDLGPALERALAADAAHSEAAARALCDDLGWEPIADATIAFFRQITAQSPRSSE
ncbi:MAG: hypothetical protein CL908_09070 [Deltaproteobacteria bacterium]|nr:hypothetical protein [Deltaproteobacteria bacterium]